IAFASAIHVFTGISLTFSVAFTAILLFVYLQAGGMWSIAFTQTINIILFTVMFVIGVIAFFINPGLGGLKNFASTSPEMFQMTNAGLQVIIVWFGTFLVNVILAQAAFQMALSSRTAEEGRKGLVIAGVMAIPCIIGGLLFGVSAAVVVPDAKTTHTSITEYLIEVLAAPLVDLIFMWFLSC